MDSDQNARVGPIGNDVRIMEDCSCCKVAELALGRRQEQRSSLTAFIRNVLWVGKDNGTGVSYYPAGSGLMPTGTLRLLYKATTYTCSCAPDARFANLRCVRGYQTADTLWSREYMSTSEVEGRQRCASPPASLNTGPGVISARLHGRLGGARYTWSN